jgi:hypothetical protein
MDANELECYLTPRRQARNSSNRRQDATARRAAGREDCHSDPGSAGKEPLSFSGAGCWVAGLIDCNSNRASIPFAPFKRLLYVRPLGTIKY